MVKRVNRDNSTESDAAAKGEELSQAVEISNRDIMVPNPSEVDTRKRMNITRSAKRFERYGHVEDGQELVGLVHSIEALVVDKETHVVSPKLLKKAEQRAAAAKEG